MKKMPIKIESLVGRRNISEEVLQKTNSAYAELIASEEQRRRNAAERGELQFTSGLKPIKEETR